jgi:hypothetical protein
LSTPTSGTPNSEKSPKGSSHSSTKGQYQAKPGMSNVEREFDYLIWKARLKGDTKRAAELERGLSDYRVLYGEE